MGSRFVTKCRIVPVGWADGEEPSGFSVLAAAVSMPVSVWSYHGEPEVRHLGPMAQDWHGALGLGADELSIHPVDMNGVALVSVQALHRLVEQLTQRVADLEDAVRRARAADERDSA